MAQLGSSAKPVDAIEWHGLNSVNQYAMALTLPAGGPWSVYELGAWLAGRGMNADYRLCLWSAGGTLLRTTSGGTVGSQALAVGNLANANQGITPYVVAGGTTLYVGFWRDPAHSVQVGNTSSGSHLHHTQGAGGTSPGNLSGASTHSGGGGIGAYLQYEAANSAPTAPTIDEPDQNEIVNDTTPLIDWTHNDPDGDVQNAYEVEIATDSGFSSKVVDTGKVTSSTTSYTSTALTRGTTYYVRVRTWDPSGEVSPFSSTRTFKIAALPTATVTSPAGSVAMPLYYTAGSNTVPKIRATWSFTCPDGGTQSSASVKVYDAAGTTLLHTHAHSGATTVADISGYTPTNGTKYQISVTPTCSHGAVGSESTKKSGQVRWGRASYYLDMTTTPLTLSVAASSTANSGQVIMEYTSTASTTEPTTWFSSIASATKARYAWHRVTLLPAATASPTSPALNSVTWTYSNNVLVPDKWTLASVASVDLGTYVYGTQSLKHTADGTARLSTQLVPVTPNTDYILSGRIRTSGSPTAALVLRLGGVDLVSAAATDDTDWTRYSTPIWNSGENEEVEVAVRTSGATGTAWFDALKLEASRVVTPWTPGFLGEAVTLDAGGLQIDAFKGGVFRLRGSAGGTRDTVRLGANGLVFGGDVELYSAVANVLKLASGDRLDNDAVGLVVRKTTTQTLSNNVTTKIISFGSTDRAGFGVTWNPGGFSEARIDVPGLYLIVGQIAFDTNATGRRVIGIATATGGADPGTTAPTENFDSRPASPSGNTNTVVTLVRVFNANDTLALIGNQAAGGTLNVVGAVLAVVRLGV